MNPESPKIRVFDIALMTKLVVTIRHAAIVLDQMSFE